MQLAWTPWIVIRGQQRTPIAYSCKAGLSCLWSWYCCQWSRCDGANCAMSDRARNPETEWRGNLGILHKPATQEVLMQSSLLETISTLSILDVYSNPVYQAVENGSLCGERFANWERWTNSLYAYLSVWTKAMFFSCHIMLTTVADKASETINTSYVFSCWVAKHNCQTAGSHNCCIVIPSLAARTSHRRRHLYHLKPRPAVGCKWSC